MNLVDIRRPKANKNTDCTWTTELKKWTVLLIHFVRLLLITRPSEISNKYHQNRTIRCTCCKQLMPRRLGQQTHRRTEQQREYDQNSYRIKRIPIICANCSKSTPTTRFAICWGGAIGGGIELCMCGCAGQAVHCYDWNNEQDEYDEGNEDVHEFVDAGTAVEWDELVGGFLSELRSAEVLLNAIVSTLLRWIPCLGGGKNVLEEVAPWYEKLFGEADLLGRS